MGGGGGGSHGGGSSANANVIFSGTPAFGDFFQFIETIPVLVWILVVLSMITLGFLLTILFFLAGSFGTAGVVKGASLAAEADPEAKPLSFKTIFNGFKPHYWKVVLLNLAYLVLSIILVMLFIIPIIFITFMTCGLIWLILIPIGWLISILLILSIIAIIEEDMNIFQGIEQAWKILTENLGKVILMGIILGIGQIVILILIITPLIAVSIIPVATNLIATGGEAVGPGLIISIILTLILIPLVILFSGVLQAYVLTSWTLTYRALRDKEDIEPIIFQEETEQKDLP
jgi:hypothetical protein